MGRSANRSPARKKRVTKANGLLSPAISTFSDSPRKLKKPVRARSGAGVTKSSRRTPKAPADVQERLHPQTNAKETEVRWKEHCVSLEYYEFPLRIYKCLRRPSAVAGDLANWDNRHDIEVLKLATDPECGFEIPDDYNYIIVGERLAPDGQALFWAKKLDEYLPTEKYDLKLGYYYSYRDSLYEWFDQVIPGNTSFPLLEPHEVLRKSNLPRFSTLYGAITAAIDAEKNWRTLSKRPYLRCNKGKTPNGSVRRGPIRTKADVLAGA